MVPDFSKITERAGDPATHGQIADMFHRYRWASEFCDKSRVLEVACGTGQGLGMLAAVAESVVGCDVDAAGIEAARATYSDQIPLYASTAEQLPAKDGSVEVVLMFEAIYYLPNVDAFLRECRRVLVPTGRLLLSSTNKDLIDFVPCSLSHTYYGAADFVDLLSSHGFSCKLAGYSRTVALPYRHRLMLPVKALANRLDLLPKTMRGKALLRRGLFGRLPRMPCDLSVLAPSLSYEPPVAIDCHAPDRIHRFLYVVSTVSRE